MTCAILKAMGQNGPDFDSIVAFKMFRLKKNTNAPTVFKHRHILFSCSLFFYFNNSLLTEHKLIVPLEKLGSPESSPASQGGGGGGGYSIFFRIRRLGPSIYRSLQKSIRNFKHPKKIFEILATQNNFPILYFDLKKDAKLHRNDPQTSPIL